MAERIQVAMQGTSEEILTAVENINIKVDDTSGVLVGTDGKKYKPVIKDSYRVSYDTPIFPVVRSFTNIGEVGDFLIVTGTNTTNAQVVDKATLKLIYQITTPNTRLLTTINPISVAYTFLLTSEYLITYSRSSATAHLLFFFDRNTGEYVHSLVINGFSANQALKLYLHGDSIVILPPNAQSFIYKYTITQLLSMDNINVSAYNNANYRDFTGQVVVDMYSYNGFIYLVTKVTSTTATTIYKLSSDLQVISSASLPGTASDGLLIFHDGKLILSLTNYQTFTSIDPETLAYTTLSFSRDLFGSTTGITPEITNYKVKPFPFVSYRLYDEHISLITIDIVGDELKIVKSAVIPYPFKKGSETITPYFFAIDDVVYSRYTTQVPYYNALIKYEPSKEIVGYEEVIE